MSKSTSNPEVTTNPTVLNTATGGQEPILENAELLDLIKQRLVTPESVIESLLTAFPHVSMLRLSNVVSASYHRLRKAKSSPIVGQVYDPEATNYSALAKVLSISELLELDWDELNKEESTTGRNLYDMSQYKEGDLVYLRRDNEVPYRIHMLTDTHVVLKQDDSTIPFVWKHISFVSEGPRFSPRPAKVEAAETAE